MKCNITDIVGTKAIMLMLGRSGIRGKKRSQIKTAIFGGNVTKAGSRRFFRIFIYWAAFFIFWNDTVPRAKILIDSSNFYCRPSSQQETGN